jgi:glycosyltransferase involved in cell wall biosynthesis
MIDVIMPTYNRLESLKVVIDSYMCQPNLGLFIFVDDASTENIGQFAHELGQKYPGKIIYHRVNKKTTLPDVRNIGVSLSVNDYIFMGEDDVLLPPDHFDVLLKKMAEHNAGIISGRRIYLRNGQSLDQAQKFANLDRGPIFIRTPFEGYFERFVDSPKKVPFLHSNVLIKRLVFDTVLYDPNYIGNAFREELDFFLRAHGAGFNLWLIPDTLSYHLKNTNVNKSGGSRKNRFVYEMQVWRNTFRCFVKNRNIFKKEFGVKNIYLFTTLSLISRYVYGFKRRLGWSVNLQNAYEK